MNRDKIVARTRSLLRDERGTMFVEADIVDFINEGLDRVRQVIRELDGLEPLNARQDIPLLMPSAYRHLFAIYATARCFAQDERHYQATTYMNEFEVKLQELKNLIDCGDLDIIDPVTGERIVFKGRVDYVNLKPYWGIITHQEDVNEEVVGVD